MKTHTKTTPSREEKREAERKRAVMRRQLAMAFGDAFAALERSRAAEGSGGKPTGRSAPAA